MNKCFLAILLMAVFLLAGCALPQRNASNVVHTWYEKRYADIVRQQLDYSCGFASLATILRYQFGEDVSEKELMRKYFAMASKENIALTLKQGISFSELGKLAESMGYVVKMKMLHPDELRAVSEFAPILVFLKIGRSLHFAVVRGMSKNFVLLADPTRGNVTLSWSKFLEEWTVPDELGGKWSHPGGMAVFDFKRPESEFPYALLHKPHWFTIGCEGEKDCSWSALPAFLLDRSEK